jgi:hypothetical protein
MIVKPDLLLEGRQIESIWELDAEENILPLRQRMYKGLENSQNEMFNVSFTSYVWD